MNSVTYQMTTQDDGGFFYLDLTFCVFYSATDIEHVQLDEAVCYADDCGANVDVTDMAFQRRAVSYFWDHADIDDVKGKIASDIEAEYEAARERYADWRRGA